MNVYLDHNIIDDISKGRLSLKPSDKVIWIYSDENLNEIKRSGDLRFLDVYKEIRARKIDLILDDSFKITGEATIQEYSDPYQTYDTYIDAISSPEVDNSSDMEFITRLFGNDNKKRVTSCPEEFEQKVRQLLEPYGKYDNEMKIKVESVRDEFQLLVDGPLQEIGKIEESREHFKTHGGRASNLSTCENPIEEIWKMLTDFMPNMTADQFFGFDPIDKQGFKEWPMFLGIIGCHTALNFIGYSPDKGLAKTAEIDGILSDGSHIAHGAYCQAIISRDRKFNAKEKAIYRYKNIATQVLSYEYKKG